MTLPTILRRKPCAVFSTASVLVLFGATAVSFAMAYSLFFFALAVFFLAAAFFGAAAAFGASPPASFFVVSLVIWARIVLTRARSRFVLLIKLVSSRRLVKFLKRCVKVSFARLFSSSRRSSTLRSRRSLAFIGYSHESGTC